MEKPDRMFRMISRYIFLTISWLFLAGLAVQMYLAGLAAVARMLSWDTHVAFGFLLILMALLQLILVFPARLPRPAAWVSAAILLTIILQVLALFDRTSALSALHPVMALLLFIQSWWLARAAFRAVRAPRDPAAEAPDA